MCDLFELNVCGLLIWSTFVLNRVCVGWILLRRLVEKLGKVA